MTRALRNLAFWIDRHFVPDDLSWRAEFFGEVFQKLMRLAHRMDNA